VFIYLKQEKYFKIHLKDIVNNKNLLDLTTMKMFLIKRQLLIKSLDIIEYNLN